MSYKALYRKYRPHSFDEVIAQDHIVLTLKNIIESQKISHAYLFCGPRGTGKTSVANIFANEINKTASGNISNNELDIVEIDAASNNGVAEVRRIINNSYFSPANAKYKVYIIDEVHMLTKGAFNALLKTLEEPPEHLVFILATTEPHKIPTTILSRTQRFNFKRIDDKLIIKQLEIILQKESIIYEPAAIKFVARIAQGGMRDALSIVDQAAAYSDNKISFVAISQVFGIISIENQIQIINLTYANKTKQLLVLVEDFFNNGIDIDRLVNSLIDVVKDYIIFKKTDDIKLCSMLSIQDLEALKISIDFAYKAINEFVELTNYIKFSEAKKQIFEIALLKLSEFNQDNQNEVTSNVSEGSQNETEIEKKVESEKILASDSSLLDQVQSETIDDDIGEHITSTQDIFIGENDQKKVAQDLDFLNDETILKSGKSTPNLEKTQEKGVQNLGTANNPLIEEEIRIESLDEDNKSFKEKDASQEENEPFKFDINELINYLQHANKDKIRKFKLAIPNVINWIDKIKNKEYVTLIEKVSLISGGSKFVIVSSKEVAVVNGLKEVAHKQDFIDLMSAVLGEPVQTIVISKEEFKNVRSKWEELTKNNNFPDKHPLKDVKISAREKSNAEKFGESLFGDLFK